METRDQISSCDNLNNVAILLNSHNFFFFYRRVTYLHPILPFGSGSDVQLFMFFDFHEIGLPEFDEIWEK